MPFDLSLHESAALVVLERPSLDRLQTGALPSLPGRP